MSKPLNSTGDFERFGHEVFGRSISLFLDFDGTLSPIAETPARAELPPESREILSRVSMLYPTAIITGRALADIREKVGIYYGITFAANHGMEIRSDPSRVVPDGFEMDYDIGDEKRAALRGAALLLSDIEARYDGLVMEDKGMTLSLHYRLLPEGLREGFKKELDSMLLAFKGRELLRVSGGKLVIELRPRVEWNKGRAVEWIFARKPFSGTYPVYIGDDETDRDGFKAVRELGASVYVGGPDGEALYHMEQGSVAAFLRWLAEFGP